MRIGIFGCGAVGGVVAGHLARAGREVVAVDPWFQNVEAIRRDGLHVHLLDDTIVVDLEALHLDELHRLGTVDLAVFAVKSYDTEWLARLVAPHVAATGTVLSAQNGMNESTLVDVFGPTRTIGCVVPFSAEMFEPGHPRKTCGDEWTGLIVGELDGPASDAVRVVAEALDPFPGMVVSDDIQAALWGKMTLNVMGNVLAGLTGFTTNTLWTDSAALDVQVALARETAELAAAAGVVPDPVLKSIDHDLIAAASRVGDESWQEVKRRMADVGETRSGERENIPSLGQDIRKQRRTEVDYLNGWVARRARAAGHSAPINEAVTAAGRQRELGVLESDPGNIVALHALTLQHYGVSQELRTAS